MLTPELRLFFGTVSVTAATLGAFSILIYSFWYDKLLERWGRMLRGVRRRNLGAEMQFNGAKEILIDVKNPLHAWKRVVDVTKDPAFPELIMQAASQRGQEIGAEGGEGGILTNRIITNFSLLAGTIRRSGQRWFLGILLLGALVSTSGLVALLAEGFPNLLLWEVGILLPFVSLWIVLLLFAYGFVAESVPFWAYTWTEKDKVYTVTSLWEE